MVSAAAHSNLDQRIETVRRFNRFYTRRIGVLQEHLLNSPFTLTECRVIYELAHREETSAARLAQDLGLNPGYLSRLLRSLSKRGLILSSASKTDRRQNLLRLSDRGQESFARLDAGSRSEVGTLLDRLTGEEQIQLLGAMQTIERLLGAVPEQRVPYILRPPEPGDMGWVVQRHGALYAAEYGWDERFEAVVAEIVAKFIRRYDPARERCWIAEKEGENVGSVLVVKRSKTVAQLRLLLVEPRARGLGIGTRLVDQCIRFARNTGYRKMVLWTNDVLHAARRIYEKTGFRLTREQRHQSFGENLVGQTWELAL